ncbi:MAG: hypothetical protein ABI325_00025 [Ginsengibacter sp.]
MRKSIYLSILFFTSLQLKAQTNGVGINTTSPEATLHVRTTNSSDLFMVQLNDSTKLKTFINGGTSIGANSVPPPNGLSVKGVFQPDSGIVTSKKLVVEASGAGNSITLKAGNTEIIIEENGNITIKSGGNISIESTSGEISLSGKNVNINAQQAINIKGISTKVEGTALATIQGGGVMNINGGIIKLNNGNVPVAKLGSTTSVNLTNGTITGNTSPTILVP